MNVNPLLRDLLRNDYLDPDAEASLRELEARLHRVATLGPYDARLADIVSLRYRAALVNDLTLHRRKSKWRQFLEALDAFVLLHERESSRDLAILRSILDENADLVSQASKVVVR